MNGAGSKLEIDPRQNTRLSNGLAEFCSGLEERPGLAILDFARANQSTISFITNYGHKLYSEDFLEQLEEAFGPQTLRQLGLDASVADQSAHHSNPMLVSRFFASAMNFTDESFDGALVWDSFEYLAPPLLNAVVAKMHRILRPGAHVLAMFHADASYGGSNDNQASAPGYRYRIQDAKTLQLIERPSRPLAQSFTNRSLEKLFQDFESVKFFLTRGNLREVIVRK